MSTDHNRIKVADLEKNEQNKILTTNTDGELEFSDINNIKTDSYNALDYSIAGKALDARQGKILKDLIDNINAFLASDNSNLNTVQELVDTIESVQTSLNNLLVNDLTTGGTAKALTAEMGKNLKGQIDALDTTVGGKQNSLTDVNFGAFEGALPTITTIVDTDKISLLIGAVAKMISFASFKTLFKTIGGVSIFGSGDIPMQVTKTATTSFSTSALSDNGLSFFGKHLLVKNGANNINITVDGIGLLPMTVQKEGTGTITFVQGSGRTLRQVDGTAILNGAVGSTSSLASDGTIDSLRISNA